VIILSEPLQAGTEGTADGSEAVTASEGESGGSEASANPYGSDPAALVAEAASVPAVWPSVAWEHALLEHVQRPVLPRVIDHFVENGMEYLVEELPTGQSLWDAWDAPQATALERFGWLKQIAGALHHLHQNNAILESLRPEMVVITPEGGPRINDLSELLPLPLPPNPPLRGSCYTAPELILSSAQADARADLYTFGAMLYALYLGRELTELDFEMQGSPKAILERYRDIHPLVGRLISKTCCRDLSKRFPTEEVAPHDPTGFVELIQTLETCRQTLDYARLEVAAWTTTGMVRGNNEDALVLQYCTEAHESQLGDNVLVLLADGMGGYEAGEVAAAMAVQGMRDRLVQQLALVACAGAAAPTGAAANAGNAAKRPLDVARCQQLLGEALRDANQRIYTASRAEAGRHGMGCTAEAVYVDGYNIVVGHVGDSRTYHLHQGQLSQLTCDQTWVSRMVELGVLTSQEAEQHPRRHELQQALGGYPDVEPALYHRTLTPGDWIVVCTDGLSCHIPADTLTEVLLASRSAESAARRLVNLANLAGATDNATVVVIRAL
jgi:protein phosphatase